MSLKTLALIMAVENDLQGSGSSPSSPPPLCELRANPSTTTTLSFSCISLLFFFSSSALQLTPATRALLFLHRRHHPSFVLNVNRLFQSLYSIHSEIRLDPLGARHCWTSHSLFSVSFIPFAFYLLVSLPVLARVCLASHHPKALLASPSRRLRHTSTLSRAREPTQFTAWPLELPTIVCSLICTLSLVVFIATRRTIKASYQTFLVREALKTSGVIRARKGVATFIGVLSVYRGRP